MGPGDGADRLNRVLLPPTLYHTQYVSNEPNFFFFLSERHDALYVVGALDETLELRGLRYHPIDIETSVSRIHRSIAEW